MTEYCRLCAELKESCEISTSISDVEQSMEQKLRACCQWTTENTEHRLPHSVCSICLDKLDKCWLFSQSVQLAQQKLIEIFDNDAEVDTETKPLATEMVQIVYECPDYSSQIDAKPSSSRKKKKKSKKVKKVNPLESNETEVNEHDDAVHKCPDCGRCFRKRWNLTEHMQRHSNDRPFECWLCHKTFTTNRSLRVHCKNQPENKCENCMREFCTATELNAHKQSPCEPPTLDQNNSLMQFNDGLMKDELMVANFNCEGVESSQMENQINQPIIMSTMQSNSSHAQFGSMVGKMQRMNGPFHTMRKKTLGPFGCEICGRLFMKNSNLTKHRTIHTDDKPFECWLCHKMFRMRENLKRHLLIHTICSKIRLDIDKAKKRAKLIEMYGDGEPIMPLKHKCEQCNRLFARRLTLRQHLTTHSDERPFECSLCHKTFKMKKTLQSHMKLHQGQRKSSAPNESNWVCELCGKAFTVKSSLKDHFQSKHSDERPHKCETCQLGFKTSRLLKLHRRTHTDLQYDCNQCEKSFRSTQSLKRHLEYHTGMIKKPFVCDVCGKGFRLNVNLVEHRRIHTGEKPYICEHCASNFRTGSSFYAHMRKIHGISVSARNREEQARITAMSTTMSAMVDESKVSI